MGADVAFIMDDAEAQRWFRRLERKVKDIEDGGDAFVGALSAVIFQDIMGHFNRQEGPEGKWAPWSRAYAEHMAKIGKAGNRVLQDSGRLRQSFIPTNWRRMSQGVVWFNPARTKRGFPYAAAHDDGGPRLPKRSFMWLSDAARGNIEKITLAHILED